MIRSLKLLLAVSLATLAGAASAQSKMARQFDHVDLGIQGIGEFTHGVSGPITIPAPNFGTVVTQDASNTVGALVTIRYSPKPYVGFEFNGSYARFTENYSYLPYQIQTQFNEFTFGYLVIPPYTIFGLKPYASVGGGMVRFAPTPGGGQEALTEGLPAVYYNLGVQKEVVPDVFGLRLGFRQIFYQSPDFFANYLTIDKRTFTSEPVIGFYLRF